MNIKEKIEEKEKLLEFIRNQKGEYEKAEQQVTGQIQLLKDMQQEETTEKAQENGAVDAEVIDAVPSENG